MPLLVRIITTTTRNRTLLKYNNFVKTLFTASVLDKKVAFTLSDIGEGIREVVVKEWFVNVGDKVSQFDNICEVQSDKASVTITSRYDGIITKLYHQIDDVALVGQPLLDLETEDADEIHDDTTFKQDDVTTEQKNEVVETPKLEIDNSSVLCIPSVRRLAKEYSLDLRKLEGTGKHGRILKEDVLKYLSTPSQSEDTLKIEQIKGFTKAMFKTMTESLKIPHFGYCDEIDVTKLGIIRKELKNIPDLDVNITLLPFLIKAASNSLKKYPIINSSIDNNQENIIYWKHHNIGVAMATKQGLAVPVIKNVQNLTILEIAKELKRLVASGKNGSFSPNDLTGATFTVSNIGIVGGTYTKPVILPPQVAIIAIGITQSLPRFDESDNIVKKQILNVSASADHRVIDGVSMAEFIKSMKSQMENPNLLFLG